MALVQWIEFALEIVRAHEGVKYFLEDYFYGPAFLRDIFEYRIHQMLIPIFSTHFSQFEQLKKKTINIR